MEKTLEEIAEKEAKAEGTVENEKRKAENAKAAEMRNRALESLNTEHRKGNGTKRRRKWNQSKKVVEVEVTQLHIYAKNYLAQKWKEEELQQQKQRVEVEGKREDQWRKQHQDMMKVLVEQTKQQQEQMLSFQQLFTLMQQQKSQIIMKLLEKRN